uniref:Uncharacterized protein n=1 Tax=Acrobeloides nanus TaxID=290746 RepID=A0A914CYJ9_9BILA
MSPRLKKSQSVKISLISPNEAKALVEKERHRRRLLRLQQMREQDKARSQLNGHLIRDMKDQLMKAVAENIAETVRQAYRIEVVPVASTLNGVV